MFVPIVVVVILAVAVEAAHIPCTTHPNGYCVDTSQERCPSGTQVSYSGCASGEQCCYIPETTLKPAVTTSSHAAVTAAASHCGVPSYNPTTKIVGGNQTAIEKYPWQVSIHYDGYHTCGGTIIADSWVLTAAHCILEKPAPLYVSKFTVIAGSSNQEYYSRVANYYTAVQILTHPQYQKNVRNDIALIKVNKAFDLTGRQKKPICLPNSGDTFTGQTCVATGWGYVTTVKEDQETQMYLREVNLPIVSRYTCTYFMGALDNNNICAGQTAGGIDACQGDSGGPLVCKNSQGVWKQAGIVSYGAGCAEVNSFGVYTEVAKFSSWIQDNLSRY